MCFVEYNLDGLVFVTCIILIFPCVIFYLTDANNNTRWVLFGESITLSCSNEDNDGQLAVWKFNDKILYAIAISPTELGFENVKGYNNNNGGSFLNITDIRFNNAGMYTCIVKGATQTEVHINVASKRSDYSPIRK